MNRRELLVRAAAIAGGVIIGGEFLLTGCARTDKTVLTPFTPDDIALLDEIGETIIPTTNSPGAKAAGIGAFMASAVKDCYSDELHLIFQKGLAGVESASRAKSGKAFRALSADDRLALLSALHKEAQGNAKPAGAKPAPPHYFRLMRELTIIGYFSSEIGATQALRYVETPGSYQGDVPYTPGDRAWYSPAKRLN